MQPSEAIVRLLLANWTEVEIASAVGTTQPTINRIKNGKQPNYALGERIVLLAKSGQKKPAKKAA